MHTDELRAELTELANEVAPFEGDLKRARRRVAKRRALSGSISAVVAIALVVAIVVGTRSGPSHMHVAGVPKQVELARLPRVDAAVVLPAGSTSAAVTDIQAVLGKTDAVESYAPLSAKALVVALHNRADASSKRLRTRVCADLTTRTFAVELARAVPHALSSLTAAMGTAATVQAIGKPDVDFEVFMQVKATPSEVATVRAAIDRDADVIKDTFVDHQAAYAEFKQLFADQPVLIHGETPAGLPESFRVEVRDFASMGVVADRYRGLLGVKAVIDYNPAPIVNGAAFFLEANHCNPKP